METDNQSVPNVDNLEIKETDKNNEDISTKILKIRDNHNSQELTELDRRYDVAENKIRQNRLGIVNWNTADEDAPIILYDWIVHEKGGDWNQIPSKEILEANKITFLKNPPSIEVLTHPFTLKCVNHFINEGASWDDHYVDYYNYYKNTDNEIIKDIQKRIKEKIDLSRNK